MSNNPLYGLRKVGTFVQLTGAAWPGHCAACVCRLHAVTGRPAALVSDEKRIRGVYTRRCAIQIDNLYLYKTFCCNMMSIQCNSTIVVASIAVAVTMVAGDVSHFIVM